MGHAKQRDRTMLGITGARDKEEFRPTVRLPHLSLLHAQTQPLSQYGAGRDADAEQAVLNCVRKICKAPYIGSLPVQLSKFVGVGWL